MMWILRTTVANLDEKGWVKRIPTPLLSSAKSLFNWMVRGRLSVISSTLAAPLGGALPFAGEGLLSGGVSSTGTGSSPSI